MEFGLSFLPDLDPNQKSAQQYFEEALILSDIAESYGFQYIKMTEHYLHPYGGYCPNPLTFLASVAARTKTIRLMTGCILPAFNHPLKIAAETAMVDAISHGRLEVGFARAYLPYEFEAFEVDINESRERFIMAINLVRELWMKDSVSVNNHYFKFKNVNSLPKVQQTPHPPIWCAAVNSRQSFSWIGEQGFNLLVTPQIGPLDKLLDYINIYRESLIPSINDSNCSRVAISLPVIVSDTKIKAHALAKIYLDKYLSTWNHAIGCWTERNVQSYPGYSRIPEIVSAIKPEDMISNKQALVGTPQDVLSDIEFINKKLGINIILLQIDFGGQPLSISCETLNHISKVIDKLK